MPPQKHRSGENPVDPAAQLLDQLVAAVRKTPGDFPTIAALQRRSGVGSSTLQDLFRLHYHTTPAAFLRRCRIDFAGYQLLHTTRALPDTAADAGFESSSAFQASFVRLYRVTPAGYRALGRNRAFTLRLSANYRSDLTLQSFGRDPGSISERLTGRVMEKAVMLIGRPARLRIELRRGEARCEVTSPGRLTSRQLGLAHRMMLRILGLHSDPAPFESMLREKGMEALIGDRTGLRVTDTATVYEALVWAIVGQQVNLAFAFKMRRAVIEKWGTVIGDLVAHPEPAQIAAIEYDQLSALQFSRSKAAYLIDASRKVSAGELDVEKFPSMRASAVLAQLLDIRGIGVWSANYVMMRGCGFGDCAPAGDTGLSSGLQKFLGLGHRPSTDETATLMMRFIPHRSLATFHLWMFNRTSE